MSVWKPDLVSMLGWLSPAPDHHCLSYLLIKFFFKSQCNLTLYPVCVWGLQGLSASYWSQTVAVGAPGLWYQLLERVGTWCLLLEWVRVLAAIHWGGNSVCFPLAFLLPAYLQDPFLKSIKHLTNISVPWTLAAFILSASTEATFLCSFLVVYPFF